MGGKGKGTNLELEESFQTFRVQFVGGFFLWTHRLVFLADA